MRTTIAQIIAAAAIATVGAVYFVYELHDERARLTELHERGQQLERELQIVLSAASPFEPSLAPFQSPFVTIANSTVTGISPYLKTPDKASINWKRIDRKYPDFRHAMNLSQEDAESLITWMMQQLQPLSADIAIEMEKKFGSQVAVNWFEYQKTIEARLRKNELGTILSKSNFPLADHQAKNLVSTITAEQQRRKVEMASRPAPTGNDPMAALDYQEHILRIKNESYRRVATEAARYLLPQQLAVMQASMDAALSRERVELTSSRAKLAAGVGITTPQR